MGSPQVVWTNGSLELRLPAQDDGAGVSPSKSKVRVGGREFSLQNEAGQWVARLRESEVQAGEAIEFEMEDQLGNRASSVAGLVPSPQFGFSEAMAVPNPARTYSLIRYRLNQAANSVRADIYDAAGRRVRRLNGPTTAGLQSLRWDLRTRRGRTVRNGIYFVDLRANGAGKTARERLKVAVIR